VAGDRSPAARRAAKSEIDDPAVVLEAAARFLEPRPRSVAEVRRRLTGAGYRPALVEGAIERLVDLGMLDDAAFARWWIESRDRSRPRSTRALRQELARTGVDRAVVEEALDERVEASPDVDDTAARRLLERHERALARVADPRVRRQRAYALLARHGFDAEAAAALVRELVPG
jgi:regulatory protein